MCFVGAITHGPTRHPFKHPYLFHATQITHANGNPLKAVAVAAGAAHTCIIAQSNDVQCWGRTWDSTGTPVESARWTVQTSDPQWEPSLTTPGDNSGFRTTHALDIKSIKAGNDHTCVVADNYAYGTLYPNNGTLCWGRNHLGQLGQGSDRSHFVDEFQYLSNERIYATSMIIWFSRPTATPSVAMQCVMSR